MHNQHPNSRKAPPPRNRQSGVLLLEVLISILIFSFAILGMVALQGQAVKLSVDAEDRNTAALLANELVTVMWSQQTVDAATLGTEINNWRTKVRAKLPPFDNTVIANVVNGTENGAATADITINWLQAGSSGTTHSYSTKVIMP